MKGFVHHLMLEVVLLYISAICSRAESCPRPCPCHFWFWTPGHALQAFLRSWMKWEKLGPTFWTMQWLGKWWAILSCISSLSISVSSWTTQYVYILYVRIHLVDIQVFNDTITWRTCERFLFSINDYHNYGHYTGSPRSLKEKFTGTVD